jgi:hypothetical protein
MRELVIACVHVATKKPNAIVDEQTRDYWKWRDTILYSEDILLETICFDLSLEPTYKIMYEMLKYLGVEHNKRLRDAAWAFLNDSTATPLCLLFTSRTIAAAALYAGAMMCGISFPDEDGKPWWEIQYVKLKDIRRACNHMVDNYEHVPIKDGSQSIYVGLRSFGDEDSPDSGTRLRASQTPMSPAASSVGMERSASDQSLKRKRDEALGMERSASDQSNKRRRENGSENGVANGTSSHAKPNEDKRQNGDASRRNSTENGRNPRHNPVANDVAPRLDISKDERDAKRAKVETNGNSQPQTKAPNAAVEISRKEEDDVSEEGEVEE